MKYIIALLVSLSLPVFAELKSEKFVEPEFISKTEPSKIEFKVGGDFHINEKAPNLVVVSPEQFSLTAHQVDPRKISFILPKLKPHQKIQASVYVCDNSLTVCEQHIKTWNSTGQLIKNENFETSTKFSATSKKILKKHGFIIDSLATALTQSQQQKKPILLLFSARWCPGCMRMENEIWTKGIFEPVKKDYILVKLDADRFQNKPTMTEYLVAGIPTMLVLNSKGEELERFVDYQTPTIFIKSLHNLKAQYKNLPTRNQLIEKAQNGDSSSALTLAKRASLTGANQEALKWYAFVPHREKELEYWWAKTAESKSAEVYQQALAQFPDTASALDWRSELAELLGPESIAGQKILNEQVKICDQLISDKIKMSQFIDSEYAGDYQGIESLKVFEAKAEALKSLKKDKESLQVWQEGVIEGKRLGIKDEPTGPFFRFLIFLKKSGENDRIKNFFEKNLAEHPKDPELLRRYGKFLFERGQYQKAADLAAKSILGSYDQNEIYAAVLYANSINKAGQPAQAKNFLLKYQLRSDLSQSAKAEIESALSQIKL